MQIFWSPLAVERLEDIYNFIARDNISSAQSIIENIIKRVETLTENPERGRNVPEVDRKEIRELFESNYRIIYRIEERNIYILTIRSFKQLLPETDIE